MDKPAPSIIDQPFFRPLIYTLVVVLLVVAVVQITRSAAITEQVGRNNLQLIQEFGQVKSGVMQYGDDLNEIRDYLLLPKKTYDFFPQADKTSGASSDEVTPALFKFVDDVGGGYKRAQQLTDNLAAMSKLPKSATLRTGLSALGLSPAKSVLDGLTQAFKILKGKDGFLQLTFDKNSQTFQVQSLIGAETLAVTDKLPVEQALLDYLKAKKDVILTMQKKLPEQNAALTALWNDKDVAALLTAKKLQVNLNPVETDEGFRTSLQNGDGQTVEDILLKRSTGEFMLHDVAYSDSVILKVTLLKDLQTLDATSERDRVIAEQQKKLKDVLEDSAFFETLKQSGVDLAEPRRVDQRLYYDLISSRDKQKLGSIIFETLTGNILLYREADKTEVPVDEFLNPGSKKNG